jgi:hypothetical protein
VGFQKTQLTSKEMIPCALLLDNDCVVAMVKPCQERELLEQEAAEAEVTG